MKTYINPELRVYKLTPNIIATSGEYQANIDVDQNNYADPNKDVL